MAKKHLRPDGDEYIPRPLNRWMVYRAEKSKDYVGLNTLETSKLVSALWKAEPASVKQQYQDLAVAAKREHELKYPDYKYQPVQKERNSKTKKTRSTRGADLYEHNPLDLDTDQSADASSSTMETFVPRASGSQNPVAFPSSPDTTPEYKQAGDDFSSNISGRHVRSNMGTFNAEASGSQPLHQQWPSMSNNTPTMPYVEQFNDPRIMMQNCSGHHAQSMTFGNLAVAVPSTMRAHGADASRSENIEASQYLYNITTVPQPESQFVFNPTLNNHAGMPLQSVTFGTQAVEGVPQNMNFILPLGPPLNAQAEPDFLNALNNQNVIVDDEFDFSDLRPYDARAPNNTSPNFVDDSVFYFGYLGPYDANPFENMSFDLSAPSPDGNFDVRTGNVIPDALGQYHSYR